MPVEASLKSKFKMCLKKKSKSSCVKECRKKGSKKKCSKLAKRLTKKSTKKKNMKSSKRKTHGKKFRTAGKKKKGFSYYGKRKHKSADEDFMAAPDADEQGSSSGNSDACYDHCDRVNDACTRFAIKEGMNSYSHCSGKYAKCKSGCR